MTRSSVTRPSAKRYFHHCSLRSEENQRAVDKAYHSFEESLLPSQSLSVCHVSTWRPVKEPGEELQKSHVLKGRGTFKKKIDWRLWGSDFVLPGLECQDSLHPWWQRREVPRCWDWRRATPGIRWLHHSTFRSEKQVRACCKFITHKEKACFNGAQSILPSTERPVNWMSQKRKSNQKLANCQIRIISGKTREQLLAEAKSEIPENMNTERILPKIILVTWRDTLILKQWKIGHTRSGYDQSRWEQALLYEELADRERALRDSRVRSFQKLEELKREQEFRLEEFSIRKFGRKSFKRCRIRTQWTIISRSTSTSVISSSSWTRKIAKPRLNFAAKYMGHAWKIGNRFCKSTSVFFDNLLRNAQSLELNSLLREMTRASKHGEIRDSKWWSRQQPILSQMAKIPNSFSIFSSNFWFLKIPSTGIPTLFQKGVYSKNESVKMSPVSAKRYKENNWRKGSRGRTELAVHLKTISTVVLAWMVIAQLHLLVNSVKMCLDAPSDWWTVEPEAEVKTAQSSVTKIQWKRWICKDHEPPKSSWRPRKSTKSWDQLSVQKFTKVTQSRKKGPSHRENWSYRASWRGGHVPKFAMRQQRKDMTPKYKEAQRELRCYFSGVSQHRLEREL